MTTFLGGCGLCFAIHIFFLFATFTVQWTAIFYKQLTVEICTNAGADWCISHVIVCIKRYNLVFIIPCLVADEPGFLWGFLLYLFQKRTFVNKWHGLCYVLLPCKQQRRTTEQTTNRFHFFQFLDLLLDSWVNDCSCYLLLVPYTRPSDECLESILMCNFDCDRCWVEPVSGPRSCKTHCEWWGRTRHTSTNWWTGWATVTRCWRPRTRTAFQRTSLSLMHCSTNTPYDNTLYS